MMAAADAQRPHLRRPRYSRGEYETYQNLERVECPADMNKNTGALSLSPIPQNDLDPLGGFYVVPIEIDAERALDWLDGNDKIT